MTTSGTRGAILWRSATSLWPTLISPSTLGSTRCSMGRANTRFLHRRPGPKGGWWQVSTVTPSGGERTPVPRSPRAHSPTQLGPGLQVRSRCGISHDRRPRQDVTSHLGDPTGERRLRTDENCHTVTRFDETVCEDPDMLLGSAHLPLGDGEQDPHIRTTLEEASPEKRVLRQRSEPDDASPASAGSPNCCWRACRNDSHLAIGSCGDRRASGSSCGRGRASSPTLPPLFGGPVRDRPPRCRGRTSRSSPTWSDR
jgi:hypothetical protein